MVGKIMVSWQDHSIETQTQDRTVTDEGGNETTETVSVTMLKITLSQKNYVDMAAEYGLAKLKWNISTNC